MPRRTSRLRSISTGEPGWTGSTSISTGCRRSCGPTSSSWAARSASASPTLRRSCTARPRSARRTSAIRRVFSERLSLQRKPARAPASGTAAAPMPTSSRSKLPDIGTTIFTIMSRRARELGALNLGQGFPDYDIDPRLQELTAEAMSQGFNQYAPMEGVIELREQIAKKLALSYEVTVNPESEVTVTCGATEAIYSAVQAVVGPGDEAIVFDPSYDSYDPAVRLAGARCIHIPLMPPGFRYDWDRIAASITPRTRLIMINTPHNPACTAATPEDLDRLAEVIRGRNIFVLSD